MKINKIVLFAFILFCNASSPIIAGPGTLGSMARFCMGDAIDDMMHKIREVAGVQILLKNLKNVKSLREAIQSNAGKTPFTEAEKAAIISNLKVIIKTMFDAANKGLSLANLASPYLRAYP